MKRSSKGLKNKLTQTPKGSTTSQTVAAPAEEVNPAHQSEKVVRCLKALNEAKRQQGIECDKLSRLKPTDAGFDIQAQTLADATKRLISARASYLSCARGI